METCRICKRQTDLYEMSDRARICKVCAKSHVSLTELPTEPSKDKELEDELNDDGDSDG